MISSTWKHLIRFNSVLLICTFVFSAFTTPPKPHLIVGNWQLLEAQRYQSLWTSAGKKYAIERLAFSGDEITLNVALILKGTKKEISRPLGYRVFEPFDNFRTPVVLMKDLCNEKTRLVFSIESLDKRFLKLKFEPTESSEDVRIAPVILTFERTAGPPENMEE